MKLIIAGGRDFDNHTITHIGLNAFIKANNKQEYVSDISMVVSGCARGGDACGENWAAVNKVPVLRMRPNWNKFGRRAGMLRNTEMAQEAEGLVAFWDGKSKGTKHMIDTMIMQDKPVAVIMYEERTDPDGKAYCVLGKDHKLYNFDWVDAENGHTFQFTSRETTQ